MQNAMTKTVLFKANRLLILFAWNEYICVGFDIYICIGHLWMSRAGATIYLPCKLIAYRNKYDNNNQKYG